MKWQIGHMLTSLYGLAYFTEIQRGYTISLRPHNSGGAGIETQV